MNTSRPMVCIPVGRLDHRFVSFAAFDGLLCGSGRTEYEPVSRLSHDVVCDSGDRRRCGVRDGEYELSTAAQARNFPLTATRIVRRCKDWKRLL